MERISANTGTQFTSTEFKEECQIRGVCLTLAAPEHQEMNGQVKVTWRTLRTIAHSLIVHARVPERYIPFALMYTTDHIFWVALNAPFHCDFFGLIRSHIAIRASLLSIFRWV